MRILMLAIATLIATTAANAASLRCGNDLINDGDSRTKLEEACGQPKAKYRQVGENGSTQGWRYVYDGGYSQADRSVLIRYGRVVKVTRNY